MFAGALSSIPGRSPRASLSSAALALWRDTAALPDLLRGGDAAVFAQARLCGGPVAAGLSFERCPDTGALAAFWGRLDDREGLARRYGLAVSDVRTRPAAWWALEAWRRDGTAAPAGLVGDFAFAIVEPAACRVFLARDAFGARPLYYRREGGAILFATGMAALQRLSALPAPADPGWMARYLADVSRSAVDTACVGILKVPPGHGVTLEGEAGASVLPWLAWRDDAPWAERRDERWVEAYRERLVEAVRARLGDARPIGIESSGGLDSASIVGVAAGLVADPGTQILCLGQALASEEGAAIVGVSRMHGLGNTWIDSVRRIFADDSAIDEVLLAIGQPQEAPTTAGLGAFHAACARHGARMLLSGFGGDEAASHRGEQARHELHDRRAWRALIEVTRGRGPARAARAVRDRLRGTRDGLAAPGDTARYLAQMLVRRELADELGLGRRHAQMVDAFRGHRRANDAVLSALRHPQLCCRLENATLLATARGVEVAWPLLDARLVQQVLSTPAIERFGPHGVSRYLHRRAVAPFVPPDIATRPGKDMGYAAAQAELGEGRFLVELRDLARRVDEALHPAAAALVDRVRLRALIQAVGAGTLAPAELGEFRRNLARLRWLDRWLKMAPGG